ncbi:Secreted beta-glucosidase sun41 [Cerrena zonata]|uniref:Secreted beta-glucosidase sun41 n=1 Tax=Cerrena zonata TaxID=2478898 RepID=A0AAW0G5E1_9APHY
MRLIMKFTQATIAAFAALLSVSAAAPAAAANDADCTTTQVHAHHKHKRNVVYDYQYVTVTVDNQGSSIASAVTDALAPSSTAAASVSQVSSAPTFESETETTAASSSAAASSAASSAPASSGSSGSGSGSGSGSYPTGDLADYEDPTEEFEDGKYSCTDFPSGQGVVALDHLGFGGFSGIENSDGSTGGQCKEGSYCSYACQSGMSKTQWPSDQPSSGVSIEKASVESKLSKSVAICRTDYPGTENMVIPTVVEGGSSSVITVIDQKSYYKWKGGKTTAQYYVNNAGIDWTKGCVWGTDGSGIGNWAPLNFGAGYDNVKIVADGDDSVVSGDCTYANGKYNGDGTDGCTVGVTKELSV